MTATASRVVAVAEDDADSRVFLERLLSQAGYAVRAATDGLQATTLAAQPDVDLLLLDWMMPSKPGIEVLRELRAAGNDVPVIMLTALDAPQNIAEALKAGADDYVAKPFSNVVLLARVERRLRSTPVALEADDAVASLETRVDLHADQVEAMLAESTITDDDLAIAEGERTEMQAQSPDASHNDDEQTQPGRPVFEDAPPTDPETALPTDVAAHQGDTVQLSSFVGRLRHRPEPSVAQGDRLAPGTTLSGRYLIAHEVGRGSFGVVYRARHVDLQLDVAVKVLRGEARAIKQGARALEQFRTEAVRACRVRHPNAVWVMDFGLTQAGQAYLVMELLEGQSMLERMQSGPLAPADAARIMAAVCSALDEAHRQGVIHQDVKASNVFLHRQGSREIPKLIDYGAAGELHDPPAGVILGTPTHMAPERFGMGTASPKADVYSAGVTLYQAITGQVPFESDSVRVLRQMHTQQQPMPPSQLVANLTSGWDDAMARLLAKEPAGRPTAAQAAQMLAELAGTTPVV